LEFVAGVFESAHRESATLLVGLEASEAGFRKLAPGRRAVHLATHGSYESGFTSGVQAQTLCPPEEELVTENPLLLSRIFLAGTSNRTSTTRSPDGDDGILTAYEVSAMNLHGVRLVVLSACESEIGALRSGEGVYGMRRAFQMAGARTVVSTLWPIRDEFDSDILKAIYEPRTGTLPATLRSSYLAIISDLRARGVSDHPVTWAAYVAAGDWR
jgi:CHAT domain-containing protein